MPEEKLTQEELVELFGPMIPMAAVDLIFGSPDHMTIGELRQKLRAMGSTHKRHVAATAAVAAHLKPYAVDPGVDWNRLFSDVATVALEAADAIASPGGVPFDASARLALAEISSIAFDMKQTPEGEHFASPPRLAFARIYERADLLLKFVDKARAGS